VLSTLSWVGFTATVIGSYGCVHVVLLEMTRTSCTVSWNHKHFLCSCPAGGVGADGTFYYLGAEELACSILMSVYTYFPILVSFSSVLSPTSVSVLTFGACGS